MEIVAIGKTTTPNAIPTTTGQYLSPSSSRHKPHTQYNVMWLIVFSNNNAENYSETSKNFPM
jgi:hypothetical protein